MTKYSWPLPGEGVTAEELVMAEISAALPGLRTYSAQARRDAALAEIVASLYNGGGLPAPLIVPGAVQPDADNTAGRVLGTAGLRWFDVRAITGTFSGDLTLAARLLLTAAASKLVPGATSFSHRNNADSADNLLIADNGDVTVRNRLLLALAVAKIIGGATSLSLRNNADSADNLLVADSGAITVRSTVSGVTTLTATTLAGTLSTPAQPNVTSLGTLSSLQVSGQATSQQFDNGTKTSNFSIDWNNGNSQRVTLGANALTVTFINGQAGGVLTLEVVQDGTGSRTVTWAASPGAVIWPGGTAPTLTTTALHADLFTFFLDGVPATVKYLGLTSGLNYTV
jgi:hypothetical protein